MADIIHRYEKETGKKLKHWGGRCPNFELQIDEKLKDHRSCAA